MAEGGEGAHAGLRGQGGAGFGPVGNGEQDPLRRERNYLMSAGWGGSALVWFFVSAGRVGRDGWGQVLDYSVRVAPSSSCVCASEELFASGGVRRDG